MITNNDKKIIKAQGRDIKKIEKQIELFQKGFPFIQLNRPATHNDGIKIITTEGEKKLFTDYDSFIKNLKIAKFVPASGAASRMFKDLFSFQENYNQKSKTDNKELKVVNDFFNNLKTFPFYEDLKALFSENNLDIETEIKNKNYPLILDYFLTEKGLNYSNLPKALLKFHRYKTFNRTAIEEHLVEGALYGKTIDNKAYIHFTISIEHKSKFEDFISKIIPQYEKEYNIKYEIFYSIQEPITDTIAVDLNNEPIREKDGSLLFRPAGHGALILNLNQIDADIIFIKNIDNIVPDRIKETTIFYKKIIGAYLIKLKQQVHQYIELLINNSFDEKDINEISNFIEREFEENIFETIKNEEIKTQSNLLTQYLDRPIRVCGMVKNVGEPGGGPFWIEKNHNISKQIVESSQIDFSNEEQEKIFNNSTHFNPVDLVCSIKNYQGKKFQLSKFIDDETGFITTKSKDGKTLKAMELPGLWNGAMANWLTVFIEVPMITFNPVKSINDLIRIEHINNI